MKWAGAIAATAMLIVACGHMEATPRLKEAQAAYDKAAKGPAAQYSPAELATAKKSLDQANASLESGDRELVDDKASLALSKTAIAESVAGTQQAVAQRDAALKELHITRDQMLSKTQEELNRERQARTAAESELAASRKETRAIRPGPGRGAWHGDHPLRGRPLRERQGRAPARVAGPAVPGRGVPQELATTGGDRGVHRFPRVCEQEPVCSPRGVPRRFPITSHPRASRRIGFRPWGRGPRLPSPATPAPADVRRTVGWRLSWRMLQRPPPPRHQGPRVVWAAVPHLAASRARQPEAPASPPTNPR